MTPRGFTIRPYRPTDHAEWRRMRTAFWPDQTPDDMQSWHARANAEVLVAERASQGLCGFAEVGERSYADGCSTLPVAYLEGWWVDPDARRLGIGTALFRAAEAWARDRGYRELASDTALDNASSQSAHRAVGFEEVERCVQYIKPL